MACDGEILVSLIEKRPSIYDFKHKDHSKDSPRQTVEGNQ